MANLAAEKSAQLSKPPPPGAPYSVALPGTEKPGRSAIYRHWRAKDGLISTLDPAVTTVHDAFEQSANRNPRNNCFGRRDYDPATKTFGPFVWESYQEVQKRRADFGVGLVELHRQIGITGTQYGVGLWCQNRPEWQITDLACMSQSLYSVSLYDTLGPDATEYIINHAKLTCVVTSLNHIPALLQLKPRIPHLKLIISLDPLDAGENPGLSKADLLNALSQPLGVPVHYIRDVEALGAASPRPYTSPRPGDISAINYTSGTTGDPKGVVLTHGNALSAASASLVYASSGPEDVFFSYLPLAHIYERASEHVALWVGAGIGFFCGDILKLIDDMKLLRPTIYQSVPRLWNRYGAAIKQATVAQPGLKGALSRHVVNTKTAALLRTDNPTNTHALYDRIWSKAIMRAFGLDRARTMVSGSAPLDPSLHQFLRIASGANLVQGYGLTETYAVSLCQLPSDLTAGSCGAVATCCEVCLRDVPDMDYLATDRPAPRGELLIRGPSRFARYHDDARGTAAAIDADGWFATGDICTVDALGRFAVVDRKKNVLKLAHGEYISPERIENVYLAACPYLAQAYVHGDSAQNALVALLGVEAQAFAAFASGVLGTAVRGDDLEAIRSCCQDARVRKAVAGELDQVGTKNRFNSYEKVRQVALMVEPFTLENALLTPTFKLKRPQTAKMYRETLDRLYEEVKAAEASAPARTKL